MRPWMIVVTVLVTVVFLVPMGLRIFVLQPFKIPAASMLPTLEIGDAFFVNKTDTEPERGAVVVFTAPTPPHHDYVKRIIALGGDEVAVIGGRVSINGQPLERRALGRETFQDRDPYSGWISFEADLFEETNGDRTYRVLADPASEMRAADFGPVKVPQGHVFLLGDNRDHSFDSRAWGAAPVESIIGRAGTIWFSSGPEGVRSERLFERVH